MVRLVAAAFFGAAAVFAEEALEVEIEHFNLLNDLRRTGFTCPGGRSYAPNPTPLQFDCRLWKASQLHSEDMAAQNYFSHTSKNGRSPWDRANAQGVSAGAENIAAGRGAADDVMTQWKNSDGHCRGMMNPDMRIFGVGRAYEPQSNYRYYWTQMLGRASQLPTLDQSCLPGMTAPERSCKDYESLSECDDDINCAAKTKKGQLKKCQKIKC